MNQNVRGVMTSLINGELSDDHELFRELYEALLNGFGGSRADDYFILKDFQSYADAQALVNTAYFDKARWARMAVLNTAKSGKFSSDRTIKQYADEIWDLKQVSIEVNR
jgi:starch phosphorylase